ncbi:MAG: hypothetical protein HZB16_00010 [Armatimonadetes bacterium]|nr:hypothetical protein [Armatimonadota bacterium]
MAIIGLTGARGSGRRTAAGALALLGYERVGFRERLRYMISMAAGLSEETMTAKADEAFPNPVTLQPFHIDGMVRLASAWRTIPPAASHKMRETARRQPLATAREVMDFVFELFADSVAETFWLDVFRQHNKPEAHPNLVVDDVTSEAERALIRELDGLLVGIDRPGVDVDLEECDLIVKNDGALSDLQDQVLAAVFGHLRGAPMQLAAGSKVEVKVQPTGDDDPVRRVQEQAAKEHDALRKRLEEVQSGLERQVAERDARIAELQAKATAAPPAATAAPSAAAAGEVEQLRARVAQLSAQLDAAQEARRGSDVVQRVEVPLGDTDLLRRETDAASLVARLSLAMGYEAGLGKRNDGQPLICVDLPSGQVTWSVSNGTYGFLPRYDKAIEDITETERLQRIINPSISMALSSDRALEREDSQLAILSGFLQDLILLAEGCKVHRAYRAKRPPNGDCPTCWAMWEAGERLTQLTGVYSPSGSRPTFGDDD